MELADYLQILRRYGRSIAAVTMTAVLAAACFSLLAKPTYTSTSTLFFSIKSAASVGELNAGSTYVEGQVQSFAKVVVSPLVLQPVIDGLGLDSTPAELAESITTTVPTNTATMDIEVEDGSPEEATRIAAAISDGLIDAVPQLAPAGADGVDPVLATVIRPATTPTTPTSPKVLQNLALGLLLGLVLGAGQAVLRSVLDQRIREAKDIEQITEIPVLGSVVATEDDESSPILMMADDRQSLRAEAYRRLRTNLQFLGFGEGERAIVVTSSVPGEGKSTTSINLAQTLAVAGDRVLLIDADLRRPTVAKNLMLEGSVGLTTVLIGEARLEDVVQPLADSSLEVLASGPIPPNPAELLGFDAMKVLLAEATSRYDVVIIDSPPLLPVTDAAVLAQIANGTMVVAGSGTVKRPELAAALSSLEQVDGRVLGVLLNRVRVKTSDQYGYRYHYRSNQETQTKAPAPRPAAPPTAPRSGSPERALEFRS